MDYLVDIEIPPLSRPYTYFLPEKWASLLDVGYRVQVPLGSRNAIGFITSKLSAVHTRLKELDGLDLKTISPSPVCHYAFHPSQMPFFSWTASYYHYPLSLVIDTAVPPVADLREERIVTLRNAALDQARTLLQKDLIEILKTEPSGVSYSQLCKRRPGAARALQRMQQKGWVCIQSKSASLALGQNLPPTWAKRQITLSPAQTHAYKEIACALTGAEFKTFLLHGVTGSGKTEIYIEAIQLALQQGRGALIIVPEIALTPQLVDRFAARLGTSLAVLHSALSKQQRWLNWQALLEGRCHVAIGARSAVFAPIQNLGLIIVDEEHDHSYKQSDSLRYHARDLAVVRAKLMRCPVILGSATPSLESYYNARKRKYTYLPLPLRHSSASQVSIDVVDLASTKPKDMVSRHVSSELFRALDEVLKKGEQAFILYNRRGFASYLQCARCHRVLECPNCSVTLTYHKQSHLLRCHYCDYQSIPPEHCPAGGNCIPPEAPPNSNLNHLAAALEPARLIHRGAGTEKVFEELKRLFPQARIDRLDSDAATSPAKLNTILQRVRNGETDILVGTQMIAKGHDLPGVTLVGVVDGDVGLHLPDFRAAERVFQLLTQASGRAGRGSAPGRVILQTRVPTHPSIKGTVEKNFQKFANQELANRRILSYPPFVRILRIIAGGTDQSAPLEILQKYRALLNAVITKNKLPIALLGPAPAPLQKLRTHWRWHLLLKSKKVRSLQTALATLQKISVKPKTVRVTFDLDPQDLL